jgi:hypothetical protein
MKNKFNAKGFWYDTESKTRLDIGEQREKKRCDKYLYFYSHLEWDVYQLLLKHFSEKSIIKEFPIVLASGTASKDTTVIWYHMDFLICRPEGEPEIYVEAKGYLTAVSRLKLQLLGINEPKVAENTHLVYRDAVKVIADAPVKYHSFGSFEEWLNVNF